jgi:hypothetical protein
VPAPPSRPSTHSHPEEVVVFLGEGGRESAEPIRIGDRYGLALDHDVEPLPIAAPNSDDHLSIGREVLGLHLGCPGRELDRIVQPDRCDRRGVWPPVGTHRRHPVGLRRLEPVACCGPWRGHGIRAAELRVDRALGRFHRATSRFVRRSDRASRPKSSVFSDRSRSSTRLGAGGMGRPDVRWHWSRIGTRARLSDRRDAPRPSSPRWRS